MAKKLMTRTFCDFCEKEIEKSTPTIGGEIHLPDAKGEHRLIDVRIHLGSTEPKKRFPHDICGNCVFDAVAALHAEIVPSLVVGKEG